MPAKRLDPAAKIALLDLQSPDDPNLYKRLIDVFIQSSDEYLNTLKRLDSSTNVRLLGTTAHSWRASASSLGAQALAELCEKLESALNAGKTIEVNKLINSIDMEYAAVRDELIDTKYT